MLERKRIVLGVTGSIAAYKGAEIASRLSQAGAVVDVVLTEAAARFICPLTFESITGRKVFTGLWDNPPGVTHITLAEQADVVLIAPATADTIARISGGIAGDMLSCVVLAARVPVIVAPAMHTAMYDNPATQENISRLRERGIVVIEPDEGRLASGGFGKGRLPDTETIVGFVKKELAKKGDLAGKNIVITSGGTREPFDPVRYLGNRSSGKTGYFLAQAARDRGAAVTLITASAPAGETVGINVEYVETAGEMLAAVNRAVKDTDCLIMAAAVSDYRPAEPAGSKIKKGAPSLDIRLVAGSDILSQAKGSFLRVGFAAETENLEEGARKKLVSKELDLVIANDVSRQDAGFASDFNQVTLFFKDGKTVPLPLMSKQELAHRILDVLEFPQGNSPES
ncbi:MAG: bifunctional phosphopantothenoylcysteine decarboxylase/phosphopantothenate--cysteine ligase CoaBC [Dehalococcoidales bacterium]|nr:bifunctional phosphopantothenoylcysteine decarboxylase/phosphopantothenate--cysteine ligase CoaBC [Dehalococcoidales bacterium]